MGYVEKILGTNEQTLYRTHQHVIALLQRILGSLFAFLVFAALAVVIFTGDERSRFIVGVIALGSLVLPLWAIVRGLRPGDEEKRETVLQRIWQPVLIGLFVLAVALLVMFRPDLQITGFIAVAVALLPLFDVVRGYLHYQNERYIITNRRVMEVSGIFNKLVRDSALEKVNDVELRQSMVGRLLGYGTVQIITGSDIGVNMFRRIANPVRFKREMLNAKEGLHAAGLDEVATYATPHMQAGAVTPAQVATTSVGDRLAELSELRQKGLITEAEFQTKRQELLDQL